MLRYSLRIQPTTSYRQPQPVELIDEHGSTIARFVDWGDRKRRPNATGLRIIAAWLHTRPEKVPTVFTDALTLAQQWPGAKEII
jgi:hypothetical protein